MPSNYTSMAINSQESSLDLFALLCLLWQKKIFILSVVSIFFAGGILFLINHKPQYQSSILLQVEENKQNNSLLGNFSKKLNLGGTSEYNAAIHAALIQSNFIIDPVIQALKLDIEAKARLPKFNFSKNKSVKVAIDKFDVLAAQVNKNFIILFDKDNHIVLYNNQGKQELEGNFNEELSNSDNTIKLKISSVSAPINTSFSIKKKSTESIFKNIQKKLKIKTLGKDTGILQITLTGSNQKKIIQILNAIAHQAQLKDIEKKSLEATKTLNFLYKQLPISKNALFQAETKLNSYRAQSGKIDIKIQTQSLLNELQEVDKQLSNLNVVKIDMLQKYTSMHPIMKALIMQIENLKTKKQTLERKLKYLPASDQIAVNLMREVEVKNSLYLILLNKIQELEFIKAGMISNLRVLSYAKQPQEPLPVREPLILVGSILLGLSLSIVLLFLKKLLFPLVTEPSFSEQNFNLNNVAIIPYCKKQAQAVKAKQKKVLSILPLLAEQNPGNLAIEALRSLRTNIQISLTEAKNNIVTILGISSGIGKTFISVNLAWLLADTKKNVLLIDGDLRRGSVHEHFNIKAKPGLVDVLNGTNNLKEVLFKTKNPNLTVLSRGTYTTTPSECFLSDNFESLLANLAKCFDIILIDTPPILLVTDAVLISKFASLNYLVIGSGVHYPREINAVLKSLHNNSIDIQGSIFNFCKNNVQQYNHYKSYYDEKLDS